MSALGIVAIGRNEGKRLQLCLESLRNFDGPVIYVDSDSSDESVSLARDFGVAVLELDPTRPMSASRARREGFRELLSDHPDLQFVFFVDGDCQVADGWLETAEKFLNENGAVAAVCGRRREQYPEQSVYNRLCDDEWDTPIGEAHAVGGDAVYRCIAYRNSGEFNDTVPAGEEPELCKRLRDCGWKIWRLDAEMTAHNAAMTRINEWWKRQLRTGYAGLDVERRFQLQLFDRIIKSACFWGLALPLTAVALATIASLFFSVWWSLACLIAIAFIFSLQIFRIAKRAYQRNYNWKHSLEIGFFTMASKVPIAWGVVKQFVESAFGKQARLIEYKTTEGLRPQS